VAEQTGLDKLTEPVLVLDARENVVKFNDTAEQVFSRADTTDRPVPLETLVGVDLSTLRETGEVELGGTDGGTFAVSYTPLSDPSRNPVGGMVVLYDLQEERQRKQQLSVLNRVLRHNLRNEMTVINGYAETLERALDDPELRAQAATISRAGTRLLTTGEKVREFDRLQEQVHHPEPVDLETLVSQVRQQFLRKFPDATIETDIEVSEGPLHTQPSVLELALSNLVENALKHGEATAPTVHIRAATGDSDAAATVEVADSNDRIPEAEIDVLATDSETPLQHGQGIGLWIVNWCVTKLNGEFDYRYDGGNQFVITLPAE
jgi:signal transduction histidine kinase